MIQIEKAKNDLIYTEYLITKAKGKRLYDLQQYRKRLKKEIAIAERNLKEAGYEQRI